LLMLISVVLHPVKDAEGLSKNGQRLVLRLVESTCRSLGAQHVPEAVPPGVDARRDRHEVRDEHGGDDGSDHRCPRHCGRRGDAEILGPLVPQPSTGTASSASAGA